MPTEQNTITKQEKPPADTLYVQRWGDLPSPAAPAFYEVTNAGETHTIHADKLMQRVLEGVMKQPVFCASRCRVGHFIDLLRKDKRVEIETDWYKNDPASGRMRFGVYRLISEVARIDGKEAQ
ncbi:hypothetical protein M3P21_21140 [Ruegeria sp. 2012CJ41-6]|uniref:Uncharacterized protein n=1 Tax=Ruegeria spongiae TaxID=2942209 RepID=A0ABT0Q844_9RHOB|nr:hypothetical protein [Ruegeria spongiae]MCL6286025.1 hypothetical protein [Ruegeria spongiae]